MRFRLLFLPILVALSGTAWPVETHRDLASDYLNVQSAIFAARARLQMEMVTRTAEGPEKPTFSEKRICVVAGWDNHGIIGPPALSKVKEAEKLLQEAVFSIMESNHLSFSDLCPPLIGVVTDFNAQVKRIAPPGAQNDKERAFIIDFGLLARLRSEDSLGFVISHEAAHLVLNHAIELDPAESDALDALTLNAISKSRFQRAAADSIQQAFAAISRDQESFADHLAVIFMRRAGYRLAGAQELLSHLQDFESVKNNDKNLNDHPSAKQRIASLASLTSSMGAVPSMMTPTTRLKRIQNLLREAADAEVTARPGHPYFSELQAISRALDSKAIH